MVEANRPLITDPNLITSAQSPNLLNQQQQKTLSTTTGGGTTTQIIQEKPVLDRVEKFEHVQRVDEQRIHETRVQDFIEVHEKPIEKIVQHPTQQTFVRGESLFEEQGRQNAELHRQQFLSELEQQNRTHPVTVGEHQDLNYVRMAPTLDVTTTMTKEVIEKPIVTEIHHQPLIEVHEQNINKTVYEPPVVTVVREAPIVEQCMATNVMPMTQSMTTNVPVTTPPTSFVQTAQPTGVIIEKGASEPLPHLVNRQELNRPM